MRTELNEGRYHSSACILNDRFIYVFGGFKTTNFSKQVVARVNKKAEIMAGITQNYIERYDTMLDSQDETDARLNRIQNSRHKYGFPIPDPDSSPYESSSSELESIVPNKKIKFFERIYIKRDNVNNVGNLICFALKPDAD